MITKIFDFVKWKKKLGVIFACEKTRKEIWERDLGKGLEKETWEKYSSSLISFPDPFLRSLSQIPFLDPFPSSFAALMKSLKRG